MLLLIVVILLILALGGGCYGYSCDNRPVCGGSGLLGFVLIVLLILILLGHF